MNKHFRFRTNLAVDLLVIVILMSVSKISVALTSNTPEIYIVTSSISPSSECNMLVWIKDMPSVNAIFAYQIALLFDTSFLECIEASIPKSDDDWIFSGLTTFTPLPVFDNVKGFALIGDSLLGDTSVIGSGPFLLAVFKFDIRTQPQLDINSYVNISNPDTFVLNEALEDISPIEKQNSCPDSVWSYITGEHQNHSSLLRPEFVWSSDRIKELTNSARKGPAELIVGLSRTVPDVFTKFALLAEENEVNIVDKISLDGEIIAVVVKPELQVVSSFEAQLKASGLSKYVEPNYEVKALIHPNDPGWSNQWGPQKVQSDYAWNTTLGNHSVLVAVADTGIDYNHTDLSSNYNASGYDWINNDADPFDDHWHGTHCAGIIAAVINNSVGVAGLAQVQVMAEKCLGQDGGGSTSQIASAIYHATDSGAKIISISLGLYAHSTTLYEAIEYAYNNDVLVVAAAGNDNVTGKLYPAGYDEVIAVAATDQYDNKAWFSNWGDWIELAAPGVDIYSTKPGGYRYASGTSMACPHVSGVAALIMSQYPNMTRDIVRGQLRWTVDDLGSNGFDEIYGWGRINAQKAVEEEQPNHDLGIIEWHAPHSSQPRQTIYINTSVINSGLSDEYNVTVELKINATLVDYDEASIIKRGETCVFNTSWTPTTNGTFKIDSIVLQVAGENRTSNNQATAILTVRLPTTLYVPQNYTTIQSAIDVAIDQDVIQVSNGTYHEHLLVDKAISICGQDKNTTVIDGDNKGTIVIMIEDNITLSGFTIQNPGNDPTEIYNSCIEMSSDWNNITSNIVKNGINGILIFSGHNEIANNTITQSYSAGIWMVGTLALNNIIGNTLTGNFYGVLHYYGCNNSRIYKNNITSNIGSGIYSLHSCNIQILENKITSNGWDGVTSVDTTGCKIKDNFLMENGWDTSSEYYGLFLSVTTDTSVYHNSIVNNTNQVEATGPPYYPLQFINWSGRWNVTGNYWSDYTGNDTNGDGIGDTPYDIYGSHKDYFPFMNPYLPGDINHDGKVDMRDIGTICRAYGTVPGDPDWNPKADLNEDAIINMLDVNIATANFGKTWKDYWGID